MPNWLQRVLFLRLVPMSAIRRAALKAGLEREFDYLDSDELRFRLWRCVQWRLLRSGKLWLVTGLMTGLLVLATVGFGAAQVWRLVRVLFLPTLIGLALVGGLIGGVMGLLINHVLRVDMRRLFREGLCAEGIPVCMACGYNLTGNASGTCPECGAAVVSVTGSSVAAPPTKAV